MKYTNKFNLPSALVSAVENHEHRKGDFSVTQLLKGATEIALERMFSEKLEMDVSEAVNMMLGTAVHKLFEEQESDNILNEHYMETPVYAGFRVSGTADSLDLILEEVTDYKTCSVWKVIYNDYDDWKEQLKAYLYLWFMETGKIWHKGKIIALLKDFSQTDAERKADYPKLPIVTIRFEFTDAEIFGVPERWTEKIIAVLGKLSNQDFGCCSESERWAKPAKYALMKKGRQSALKLYDTEEEALTAKGDDQNLYIEYRAGEDVKCKGYCVAGKCGLCEYRNAKEKKNEEH